MKNLEIVVETEDGLAVHLNQGQTYFANDGRDITYEQMLKWILDGSLKQHGFRCYKRRTSQFSSNNNHVVRHAINTALIAATI